MVKNETDSNQIYDRELNVLEKATEIGKNKSLPIDELFVEYNQLRNEYGKLLKQTIKITRIGDANQRKLLHLWRVEQVKLQLAQIEKEKQKKSQRKIACWRYNPGNCRNWTS